MANPLRVVHRIGGAAVGLICCALLLSACGVPRALPGRAAPQTYASLDPCGVVPIEDLRESHPDVQSEPTISIPASCVMDLNDDKSRDDSIWISIVDSDLPDAVRTEGGTGVTDESLDGGTVVDVAGDEEHSCVSYVLSDSGIWLGIHPGKASDDALKPRLCKLVPGLARAAVERLNSGVPTIDWPVESLFRKDICAVAESSGLAKSLGVEAELRAHPTHLQCGYSTRGSTPGRLNAAIVSVDITGRLPDEPNHDVERLTIAGHRAELDDSLGGMCVISIDFGPNPEIDRRYPSDERESLHVSLMSRGQYDCESAVPAVTQLVESLE